MSEKTWGTGFHCSPRAKKAHESGAYSIQLPTNGRSAVNRRNCEARGDGSPCITSVDTQGAGVRIQVKSLDWRARIAQFKGKAPPAVAAEVQNKIEALIGP